MKFDYYCVALVVLVLFFLYLDNNNNLEGFASIVGDGDGDDIPKKGSTVQFSDKPDTREMIGAKPQKLKVKSPPSMKRDLEVSKSDGLGSLDAYFAPIMGERGVSKQIPTNLLNLGSRVGGPGNTGDPSLGSMGGASSKSVTGKGGKGGVMGVSDLSDMWGAPVGAGMDTPIITTSVNAGSVNKGVKSTLNAPSKQALELHMVYTTWCGHSKRALPDFDKVANELHGTTMGNYNISVVKHDADTDEGKAFAKEHGVKGFPTHFLIVEGKKIESGVGRTYDEIMGKIKSLTGA